MELIELDATAQRALELLTNAGMSDGSIYDYTHTGFGSILRHFHTKSILYENAASLQNCQHLKRKKEMKRPMLFGFYENRLSCNFCVYPRGFLVFGETPRITKLTGLHGLSQF